MIGRIRRRIFQVLDGRGLTDDQKRIYHAVTDGIDSGRYREMTIAGYAGTGKTYVTGRIAETLRKCGHSVIAAGTTHKAAREIAGAIGAKDGKTIHHLLGLRVQRDGKGGYTTAQAGTVRMNGEAVVIVDEASMAGESIHEAARSAPEGVQWIWVGDPAQLPPVGEERADVFDLPGGELRSVVRQGETNPIVELATCIRTGSEWKTGRFIRYAENEGIAATSSTSAFLDSAAARITKNGSRHGARILTFTNERVRFFNREIRARIYGEGATEYERGEELLAKGTWYDDGREVLRNSERLVVRRAKTRTDAEGEEGPWKVWDLSVRREEGEEVTITVLAEEERKRYMSRMDVLKKKGERGRTEAWRRYYAMKEQYANVGRSYATTIHRSQGETIETAYVDVQSTEMSRSDAQRRSLLYVAVTRPETNLALLV